MTTAKHILATLAYFHLFEYPLKKQEIIKFSGEKSVHEDFEATLAMLLRHSLLFRIANYYSLVNDPTLADKRYNGNERATRMLRKARKAANIIARFPFVKGVAVSGSLSKNFADESADVDFFIITSANRLWIGRTMLHLFKKITFLFRKQHLFCMNYFIDEAELTILEKNIYTATEVVTILPLHGHAIFEEFFTKNSWTKKFLPNYVSTTPPAKELRRNAIAGMIEFIFTSAIGERLDNFLMKLTVSRWTSKTRHQQVNEKGNVLAMHSGKHFSKPDPARFQKHLLYRYELATKEMEHRYNHIVADKVSAVVGS